MFQTPITKALGIRYPIIGGCLMWITTPEFTASISEAGGLGILASAMYRDRKSLEEALDRTKDLTDKPFGVNLNLFPMRNPVNNMVHLDVLQEKKIKIVETSGHGIPEDLAKRIKESGLVWMHKCVGPRYAKKARSMGVDVVTVVGFENGGATGNLDLGTIILVPRVADCIDVPLIGGGGVSDARGFLAMLALGAQGVIMGTRMLTTEEAPIHHNLKEALIKATESDTILIMHSLGSTHRVWSNAAAKKCATLETAHAEKEEVLKIVAGNKAETMYRKGDLESGTMSCGQGVGLAYDIPTVKELFDRIISQASNLVKQIGVTL